MRKFRAEIGGWRTDGRTPYGSVQSILQILRGVDIVTAHFVVADENERASTAYMRVFLVDPPLTNCAIVLESLGERIVMGQESFSRAQAEEKLGKLVAVDPSAPIGISCSQSNSVQDLVNLLDMCEKWRLNNACLFVSAPATNIPSCK